MKFLISIIWIGIIGIPACKSQTNEASANLPVVIAANDSIAYGNFKRKNIKKAYGNILDSQNHTQKEYDSLVSKWTVFLKKISVFMKERNFKWDVPDSVIKVRNQIYFDKDGKVDYYTFKILTPGVSPQKQEEFSRILREFSKQTKLNIIKNTKYKQCGTSLFLNKNKDYEKTHKSRRTNHPDTLEIKKSKH